MFVDKVLLICEFIETLKETINKILRFTLMSAYIYVLS